MGRISDIVPSLYFTGRNDLKKFLDALDVSVSELENKIKKLPELIDVDTCPDDKLVYLAAMTGCPLVGENPVLRRRQIRNWPHLLKFKGTQKSLELYLNSIGADKHKIMTYFRNADGSYIETKPEGEPFKGEDGLWYNIRTHYFGLEIVWNDHEYLRWQDWNEDLEERIAFWMKNFKPFHAELLKWENLIYEQSYLNFSVGTAIFQSPYHVITYNQATESRAKFYINFNAGLFGSKFQSITPLWNDTAQSKLKFKTAAGLFGAKTQKIKPVLNTMSVSGAALSTGGAKFCSKFYTVKSRI